ncbi:MAG: C4-dicarboxylate TRAP transporter substrate-binding protein [Sneathiella sp.]
MNYIKHGKQLLVAGLLTAVIAQPAIAAKVLTYTDGSSNRGTRAEATMWFAKELEKRTNGELKMEFHWGGALLKAKAAAKGIGAGAADMGFVIGLYNPKLHLAYGLGDYPTAYSDAWVANRAMYDLVKNNKDLQTEFDKLNLKHVTNVTSTQIQLVCKGDAVKTISDIKGKKVRGIGVYGKVFKDLGATPVRMSVYKAYQGLDTGLIDCTQIYSYAIPSFKLQEVASEVTLLDWGSLLGLSIAMNKDTWNELSPEHKEVFNKLSIDFIDHYSQEVTVGNDAAIESLKKAADGNKVTIHNFSGADKASLVSASQEYVDTWRTKAVEQGINADGLVSQYDALLKKYDEERKSKGYPWTR